MKKNIAFIFVLTSALAFGQEASVKKVPATVSEGPVKWMSFEEAVEKSKTEKRKIFIDVFTDWCGWCKVMDKNTFSEAQVAKILNEEFYPVKFDAEQREDVVFNGTTFKFIPSGNKGYHQLAAALLNNQLSYPNFVFLNEEFHIIPVYPGYQSLPGYRKPEEFHLFLSFVIDDSYKKMQIDEYQKSYKSPYAAPAKDPGTGH
jgi:thioredoxin-related protein